jgi:hypothetical protein
MDPAITTVEQARTDPTLATFLLDRLSRLVARQSTAIDERQRILLARSTFSVFLDCYDLGLGPQAQAILARDHAPAGRISWV